MEKDSPLPENRWKVKSQRRHPWVGSGEGQLHAFLLLHEAGHIHRGADRCDVDMVAGHWPSGQEALGRESSRQTVTDILSSVAGRLQQKFAEGARILNLENRLSLLERRLSELETSIIVPIQSFAPEPYDLIRRLEVVVRSVDDGFVASFFDASIHTSGETRQGAVENLKSLILDIYADLTACDPQALGPGPRGQLAVLKTFIKISA